LWTVRIKDRCLLGEIANRRHVLSGDMHDDTPSPGVRTNGRTDGKREDVALAQWRIYRGGSTCHAAQVSLAVCLLKHQSLGLCTN